MPETDPTLSRPATPGLLHRAFGGGVLLLLGLAILWIARGYPRGRLSDMGPGYVPLCVGVGLCLLALAILVTDLRGPADRPVPRIQWRELGFICAAVLIFAGLIQPAGLVPAMLGAVVAAKLADPSNRLPGIVIYAALAALAGWGLFLGLLDLPIPAFWR